MNQFGGNQGSLPGIDSGRETALQHRCLAPGNRMHRKITDPGTLLGERKLLQYSESMWQHFRPGEIRKPKAEIDWIGHINLECLRVAVHAVGFRNSKLFGAEQRAKSGCQSAAFNGCSGSPPGLWGKIEKA